MDCHYCDQDIHPSNMLLTQQNFGKNVDVEGSFCMDIICNLTDVKLSNSRRLRLLVSVSPVGLILTRDQERQGESRASF